MTKELTPEELTPEELTPEELTPAELTAGIPTPEGQRFILGIAGPPGAGKSTVTTALVDALRARDGDVWASLGMDGYHLSNHALIQLARRDRKGAFDTFDVSGFVAAIARIRNETGSTIYLPVFHREIEESIAAEAMIGPEVRGLIIEGNYLLLEQGGWEAVRPLLDACWFVDADPQVVRNRLVERASATYGSVEAGEDWVTRVDEPNGRLINTTRLRADRQIRVANL
jgi:pantothenate kinase